MTLEAKKILGDSGLNYLIAHYELISEGQEDAFLLSLVPIGVNISRLELTQAEGGMMYRDGSTQDWIGCVCAVVPFTVLENLRKSSGKKLLK